MKESQAEIQAIQARLQQIGRLNLRQSNLQSLTRNPVNAPLDLSRDDYRSNSGDDYRVDSGAIATVQQRGLQRDLQQREPDSQSDGRGVNRAQLTRDPATELQLPGESSFSSGMRFSPSGSEMKTNLGRSPQPMAHRDTSTRSTRGAYTIPQPPHASSIQRLDAQAQRINELSAVQEAAMLELKAIADQLAQDRTVLDENLNATHSKSVSANPDLSGICEYLPTAVPKIERDRLSGTYVLTARSVDLLKKEREAQQDAVSTAETIRRLHRPGLHQVAIPSQRYIHSSNGFAAFFTHRLKPIAALVTHLLSGRPQQQRRPNRSKSVATPINPSFSIPDAVLWVMGAAVVRLGLDALLAATPALWPVVVLLVIMPAVVAMYQATVNPKSGFLLGYRLLLVMIGLLLGGRI
jgi:hypothetical protein